MKTLKFSIGTLLLCGLVNAQQYTVTTVAGTGGSPGNSGDFGPAISAQFTNPIRVAVDSQGNLYITDYSNQLIRRVDHTTGVVTPVAGSGTFGFSNDGMSGA